MIRALGYSHTEFKTHKPGRLCRGRERWIEPWEVESPPEPIWQFVASGAAFTDDSAADAQRGLQHSGLDLAAVIAAFYPRKTLIAFMEDGHPADIPDDAQGVEMYTGHRAGGRSEELMVRWFLPVSGVRQIREVLGQRDEARVLGFVVLRTGDEYSEDLADRLFQLVGMGALDSPPARFQPAAMHVVLEVAQALILLHRDKHGPALGVYANEPITAEDRLLVLAKKEDTLPVPFAIPPMLARWDRALAEARTAWIATHTEEFPVPAAPEDQRWRPRRGRGRDRASFGEEAERASRKALGEE